LAQRSARPATIGFLHPGSEPVLSLRAAAIADGLRHAGLVENRDFVLDPRGANFVPERLEALAAELVAEKVTAIVVPAMAAEQAALSATHTIPIIAIDLETDPAAAGLVASFAHPGGNLTGVFLDFPEFSAKWLQFLQEAIPGLHRLAVLQDTSVRPLQLDSVRAAAAPLGIDLQILLIRTPADFGPVFETAKQGGAQALLVLSSPLAGTNSATLADLATRHRLPALSLFVDFAQAGGLLAYGPDISDLYRQVGEMVAKVLAGRSPAELPIERPTRIRFVINAKTAAALGITMPLTLLARADEVIE
jgi:putative ABC transport system substrate-binding protein